MTPCKPGGGIPRRRLFQSIYNRSAGPERREVGHDPQRAPACAFVISHATAPDRAEEKKAHLGWRRCVQVCKMGQPSRLHGDNYMIAQPMIQSVNSAQSWTRHQGAEMSTTYTYPDAYLAKFCTEAIEDRAVADIAVMGTFNAYWTEKLVVLRAYILVCLENQADPDDLFTAKLKSYRRKCRSRRPVRRRKPPQTRPMLTARSTGSACFPSLWSA